MGKILLVDDDRTNNTLLRMFLEMDGFQVLACPNVEKARSYLDSDVAALVIDCNLAQGGDGLVLLRTIRDGKTSISHNTPVIVTSGDDRRRADAQRAGANRFLQKPFSPGTLSKQLLELIS